MAPSLPVDNIECQKAPTWFCLLQFLIDLISSVNNIGHQKMFSNLEK